MLNLVAIKSAMAFKGMGAAELALACDVSREAVSNWLSGESVPRPRHLLKLAQLLGLTVKDLYLNIAEESSVLLGSRRTNIAAERVSAAVEDARNVASHVEQLQMQVDKAACNTRLMKRYQLRAPTLSADYLDKLVAHLRESCGLPKDAPLELRDWVRLLVMAEVSLTPVVAPLGGSARSSCYAAALVRDPETDSCVALLAVDIPHSQATHWLAWCWAAAVVQPTLEPDRAQEFATALATKVAPIKAAHKGDSLATALGFDADTGLQVIERCEALLDTKVFKGLDLLQRADGGRDHAFMMRTLRVGAGDAYELTGALWFKDEWPVRRLEAMKMLSQTTTPTLPSESHVA